MNPIPQYHKYCFSYMELASKLSENSTTMKFVSQ
jgi:hypothetical protein